MTPPLKIKIKVKTLLTYLNGLFFLIHYEASFKNNNNNNNNSVRPSRIKFIVLGLDVISIIFFWTYIRLNAASTGD
jgi:hypothetical protein